MTTAFEAASAGLQIVVMAKRPEPGLVKTRLVAEGFTDAEGAAAIAAALLECTVCRLARRAPVVLAVSPDTAAARNPAWAGPAVTALWERGRIRLAEQGAGDLGARLARVWSGLRTDAPVAFFGTDSPDVPDAHLDRILPALRRASVAAGPTPDGGYWTLAARSYLPRVVERIDWGSESVYDQTRRRVHEAGVAMHALPVWFDVDLPDDVDALRRRLAQIAARGRGGHDEEPALQALHERLVALFDSPGARARPAGEGT